MILEPTLLNALTFEPHGVQIIEASAGTGKTWTLAALYVRLVLGDGRAPLEPRQILVMTFTDAAMEELRERIRARLALAARVFHEDPSAREKADAFLLELRNNRSADRLADALRLDSAARSMDEAAIFTIHGWSHRMLREHAFESASLFEQRKIDNPQALQLQVLHDYWRLHIYTLSAAQSLALPDFATSPANLLRKLKKRIAERSHQSLIAQAPSPDTFAQVFDARSQWCAQVQALEERARQLWREHRVDLEVQLAAAYEGHLKKPSFGSPNHAAHMQAMRLWAEGGAASARWPAKFTLENLTQQTKQKCPTPVDHFGVYQAIQNLEVVRAQAPAAWDLVYDHAADWICAEVTRRKLQRGEFDFHDLLQRLHYALNVPGSGLPAVIRAQYPVALVDEFQDTDALQYGALEQIYLTGRDRREDDDSALVMIGDPKQAIYRFRGADLGIYMQARDAADQIHTLSGNFRSSKALVDAVNHVFLKADKPFGNIPYQPVTAQKADSVVSVLRPDGTHWPALTVWTPQDITSSKKPALQTEFSQGTATQIVALLHEGQVKPEQIAVLVRTGKEARLIRKALQERDVATVYLSERDSVYQSSQALQLWYVLAAVLRPRSLRAVRAAVATRLYGLIDVEREQLLLDDVNLEGLVEDFLAWQDVWRTQGVLAMVHKLLHQRGVAAALLARSRGGERELTNVLHLAALLQEASASLQGETALLRFLGEQIGADDNLDSGAAQLRLETDAALVKVITLHKSKGLEYPVVFLPFSYTSATPKADPGEDKNDPDVIKRIEEEQAESVRLLYVALTRAERALFMSAATPGHMLDKTSLYRLLNRKTKDDLAEKLSVWGDCSDICIQTLPAATNQLWRGNSAVSVPRAAEPLWRRHRSTWRSTSFSSMTRDLHANTALPKTSQDELREDRQTDAAGEPAISRLNSTWSGLKGGERLGTAMHDLLECQLHEGWPVAAECRSSAWLKLLRKHVRNLTAEQITAEQLTQWVHTCTHAVLPMGGGSLQLRTLGAQQAVAEMPFVLTLRSATTRHIDALLQTHVQPGQARVALSPDSLQGQLVGSLDVVIEYEGRWYVMDYKTNQMDADTHQAMTDKILEKRYDLQYSLYLLALHRLLKLRLPDYDYDQHIGGALYFFLRLVDQPGGGLYHDKPPRQFIEELDAHFSSGAA